MRIVTHDKIMVHEGNCDMREERGTHGSWV